MKLRLIGAFGEVRKCMHKNLRTVRAVKILKKEALDEKDIERFIHEIDILKTLVLLSYLTLIGSSKYFETL